MDGQAITLYNNLHLNQNKINNFRYATLVKAGILILLIW